MECARAGGAEERQPGEAQLLEPMSDIDPRLLQLSDFVLPLDEPTRDMYNRLLNALM
jgi:hypothetical protein